MATNRNYQERKSGKSENPPYLKYFSRMLLVAEKLEVSEVGSKHMSP
jgi:hypothetical protein